MSETPDFVAPDQGQRDGARPRFYQRPVLNNFKTQQEGRPIHDNVDYVEILIPGDRLNQIDRPVKAEDKQRWPQAYAAYKAGQEAVVEGTALVEWTGIDRAQAEDLRYFHVMTVEQLAGLSDEQLKKAVPMGGFDLRARAQRFLELAAGAAPMEKLAAENEVQKATIEQLKSTVADLKGQVDTLLVQMKNQPTAGAAPPQV